MAKKRKYQRRKKQTVDLKVIGTIVFSVLLAVLLYANSGAVGEKLNEVLGGMMGWLRYILPIGTFAIAIKIACEGKEEEYISHKLVQYALLLIFIDIVMSIYQISQGRLEVTGNLSQILKKAYTLGGSDIGGGAIGTLAAVPLVRLLGNLGAVVLSIGVSVMLFAFVFGIDISELISKTAENLLAKHEENKQSREERRQARFEEEEARRAEILKARQQRAQQLANNAVPEQIKINLNGREIEEQTEKQSWNPFRKKAKQENEDSAMSVAEMANSIDTGSLKSAKPAKSIEKNETNIEDDLFMQEEEQREDKTKQV